MSNVINKKIMGLFFISFILVGSLVGIILYNDKQKQKNQEEYDRIKAENDEKERQDRIERQKSYNLMRQREEMVRQATMIGDNETIAAIDADTYDGPLPELWSNSEAYSSAYPDKLMIVNVAGINHRTGIKSYVGKFNGVLVPDPKNDYDPEAIKVKAEDGKHVGFIPEDLTADVRELIGHPDVTDTKWRHRVSGFIAQREDDYDLDSRGNPRRYFIGVIDILA